MGKDKLLFRSQFDNGQIVALLLCTVVFIIFHYMDKTLNTPLGLFILIGTLFNYLLLAIFQSRYYFYEDRMERVFVFRPFLRRKVFMYEQLNKIRYNDGIGYGECIKFIVFIKKKQYFKYFNRFIFSKQNKRVEIVEFLLSKNITMEVRTNSEKRDKEIIDMVKKKYPQNIRLDPQLPKSYQERILKE